MNLQQFRTLGALLRLPEGFPTADIVRETGVSADVVRKTYSRYGDFFEIIGEKPSGGPGGVQKMRRLKPSGKDAIRAELRRLSADLPAPSPPTGPEGEPLGLRAAERIVYDLFPVAEIALRGELLREARSHSELVEYGIGRQSVTTGQPSSVNAVIRVRLAALRRVIEKIDVLQKVRKTLAEMHVSPLIVSQIVRLAEAMITDPNRAQLASDMQTADRKNIVFCGINALAVLSLSEFQALSVTAREIARAVLDLHQEAGWKQIIAEWGPWDKELQKLLYRVAHGIAPAAIATSQGQAPYAQGGRLVRDVVGAVVFARGGERLGEVQDVLLDKETGQASCVLLESNLWGEAAAFALAWDQLQPDGKDRRKYSTEIEATTLWEGAKRVHVDGLGKFYSTSAMERNRSMLLGTSQVPATSWASAWLNFLK